MHFNINSTLNDKNSTTNDTQSIVNKLNEKSLEFNQFEIYLYSTREDKFISNTKTMNIWAAEDNELSKKSKNLSLNIDPIISNILKNLSISNSKVNNNKKIIYYNTIYLTTVKISIVSITPTGLIALGVFTKETKSGIIRIYLLNMIISYINFEGDKDDFLKSKVFNEINNNENNNMNKLSEKESLNFINSINSKIYDTFLSIPIQLHFNRIIKKIFKRQTLYIKDIYYKNYYLIDIDNEKIILSLETLNDKNGGKEPEFKTSNQNNIWKELMLHCHNLKNDYLKKNNMTYNGIDVKNFFVKVEFKVTYPRRNFIIKFLPILNGLCLIHEYIQKKLSTFDSDEKKNYNEKSIIYGYDEYDNVFKNSDNRYFENEHYCLRQVHFFFEEMLFCSKGDITYFFTQPRKPKIYFSEEILIIIEKELIKYINEENLKTEELNFETENNSQNYLSDLINRIINVLYENYIQLNNSNKKIIPKSSNINNEIDTLIKLIESLDKKKSLQISKSEALIYLFYSVQYNKNINPNDITIDLNDEKISQMQIENNENNSVNSSVISGKKRMNSIRLSDLLTGKISMKPSKETGGRYIKRDSKFPYDTEIEEEGRENENSENNYNNINIKETDEPSREVEYNDGNNIYLKGENDINQNHNFDNNEIMNNNINYINNDDNNYQLEMNNINSENFSDINYQNNVINTNYNIDEYTYNIRQNQDNMNINNKFNAKVRKLNLIEKENNVIENIDNEYNDNGNYQI